MSQSSERQLGRRPLGEGEFPLFLGRINWGAFFLPLLWSLVYKVAFWAILLVLLNGTTTAVYVYLAFFRDVPAGVLAAITALDSCISLVIRVGLARGANISVWERARRLLETDDLKAAPVPTVSQYVTRQRYWAIGGLISALLSIAWILFAVTTNVSTPSPTLYSVLAGVGIALFSTVGLFVRDRQLAAAIAANHEPVCEPESFSWPSLKTSRRTKVLAGVIIVLFLYGQWAGGRFERPPSRQEIASATKRIAAEVPNEYSNRVTLESVTPVFGYMASASGSADTRELLLGLRRYKYAAVFRVNGADARFTLICPRNRKVYEADMAFFGMLEDGVAQVIEYYSAQGQEPPLDVFDSTEFVAKPQPGARYWTIYGYDSAAGDEGFEREPIVVLEQGEGQYKRIPDPPHKDY